MKTISEMLTDKAATPLPWRVERDTSSVSEPRVKLVGANGNTIADNEPYYPEAIKEADAEFIVARVNAHAALVAALEAVEAWWEEHKYDVDVDPEEGERNRYSPPPAFVTKSLAALALARKGG